MKPQVEKKRVLLTGAAGYIGGLIASRLSEQYEWILTDRKRPADTRGLRFMPADISDLNALQPVCRGSEIIVHLAGMADLKADWDALLPPNIIGAYNILQAACEAGCKRVIFASSIHVVDGYAEELEVRPDMPVAPLTLYGASKAWGEALAAYYARQKNLSVFCLRIGWVTPRNGRHLVPGVPHLEDMITHEDLLRLITAGIEAPDAVRFGIFHGISDNHPKRWDLRNARELLHYEPRDDAFILARRNYSAIGRQLGRRVVRKVRKVIDRI
ncbi:MAG: NAD(P)-dependent oxidoreductase [Anaerolineales bacterium]|nr:NAD(P)-dependent oxidoreductase [Anaerolineales bacterium]